MIIAQLYGSLRACACARAFALLLLGEILRFANTWYCVCSAQSFKLSTTRCTVQLTVYCIPPKRMRVHIRAQPNCFSCMLFCFVIVRLSKWTRFLIKFNLPGLAYDSYFYTTMARALNAAQNKPKNWKEPKTMRIAEKRRRMRTRKVKKNRAHWRLKQPEWTNERTPNKKKLCDMNKYSRSTINL